MTLKQHLVGGTVLLIMAVLMFINHKIMLNFLALIGGLAFGKGLREFVERHVK